MYHRLVARQVRRIFADLNRGDPATKLAGLGADFVYRFHGQSPLGGERRTLRPHPAATAIICCSLGSADD